MPYTRGPEYSRPHKQIIDEAKNLTNYGAKEIILLGQNVNAYNDNGFRLSNLIYEIEKIKKIQRIRFTTSHPKDMTDDLIDVYKVSKKLMPLVHLPVQSGSNKILNLMNRKHTIKEYLDIFEKLKDINSSIEFSSDFIIGYPQEEEEDFNHTLSLIKKIKFINSYSFIFSPRPGTVANELKLIDESISKKRLKIIQDELFKNQIEMNKSLENRVMNVLVENFIEGKNKLFGRSDYMTPVIFDGQKDYIGKVIAVKITKSNRTTLFGTVIDREKKRVA